MRLTVLGRSPARPNPGEVCAGYLVEADGTRVLMDVGPGVVGQLLRLAQPAELSAIVISHMHSDHMLDLVTMRYAFPWRRRAREQRLRVVTPPGSAEQFLDLATGVGNRRHFEDAFEMEEHDGQLPFQVGGLELTPIETQHYIPCWGFRVAGGGRRLAYSADSAPCGALHDLADAADLFLCEAAIRSLEEDEPDPARRGHLLPAEAGDAARAGRSSRLLLTHLPVVDGADREARASAAESFGGPVDVAEPMRAYDV